MTAGKNFTLSTVSGIIATLFSAAILAGATYLFSQVQKYKSEIEKISKLEESVNALQLAISDGSTNSNGDLKEIGVLRESLELIREQLSSNSKSINIIEKEIDAYDLSKPSINESIDSNDDDRKWWEAGGSIPPRAGKEGEYLAIESSYPIFKEEEATKAACSLLSKRQGTTVVGLNTDSSVQIWINEAKALAAVTLGSGYTRETADVIRSHARARNVSSDIIITSAENWTEAKPSVNILSECRE